MNTVRAKTLAMALPFFVVVTLATQQVGRPQHQEGMGCEQILDLGFHIGMATAFMTTHKQDLAARNVDQAKTIARRSGVTSGAEFDAVGSLVRRKEWDAAYAQLQRIRRDYRSELEESTCM